MRTVRGKRFNAKVTFQSASESTDAYHEVTKTWSNISSNPTVWAYVEPVKGSEVFEAQKVNAKHTILITIRPRNDLTGKMRVVFNSNNYELTYVPPYEPRKEMILHASLVE